MNDDGSLVSILLFCNLQNSLYFKLLQNLLEILLLLMREQLFCTCRYYFIGYNRSVLTVFFNNFILRSYFDRLCKNISVKNRMNIVFWAFNLLCRSSFASKESRMTFYITVKNVFENFYYRYNF